MTTLNTPTNELLTERDVARRAKLSVAAIRRRRLLRQEPQYLKLSSSVRYRMEDIEQWLDSCRASQGRGSGEPKADA